MRTQLKADAMSNLSLLDKSIDEIEDLAGFAVPPAGMYSFRLTMEIKMINDKETVSANYEVLEALEFNDPESANDPAAKPGTKFSVLYFIDQDIAVSRLKELTLPIAEATGERNMLKLVQEVIKDMVVVGKLKHRADKKDKDKIYADVKDLIVS